MFTELYWLNTDISSIESWFEDGTISPALVIQTKTGREHRFDLNTPEVQAVKRYLDTITRKLNADHYASMLRQQEAQREKFGECPF